MRLHDVVQSSPEWYQLRLGKPTASAFSRIVTPTGRPSKQVDGYAMQLAAELFVGHQIGWDGNAWSERGKEFEADAVSLYEFTHDVEVQRVGFVTDDAFEVGCSPDGFVGEDGMIEIKSLKAENHVAAIMEWSATGLCPTDYVPQTQGQLLLTERVWCDLVFFHPELPLLTIRQTPLPEFAAVLRAGLLDVIAKREKVLETLQSMKGK